MSTTLSVGELGLVLFAMFQLAPLAGRLNKYVYRTESYHFHFVQTRRFVDELERLEELLSGSDPAPNLVETLSFEDVRFSYNSEEETVLNGVSFEVRSGEFVGFVGQSGAGKSTIVSLLARMYEPDSGTILANGSDIATFDVGSWRERIAVIR